MSAQPQLAFDLAPTSVPGPAHGEPQRAAVGCFGLHLDHRALFDALTSEWLEPSTAQPGYLLARGGELAPPRVSGEQPANLIELRAWFELRADPSRTIWALRGEQWVELRTGQLDPDDAVLWWPGPLPTHGLRSLEVANEEQRARLRGMARQVSNLSLPPVELGTLQFTNQAIPTSPSAGIVAPRGEFYDQARGAAAMGWWALPRTPPWFELLVSSFNASKAAFAAALEAVEAPWLAQLPWRPRSADAPPARDLDAVLWSAACQTARSSGERAPTKLASAIAELALAAAPDLSEQLLAWSQSTRAILRAERDLDAGQGAPVGVALQLALARSSPEQYKTWAMDHQSIPPAVWWTGALLSGLLCGYRELPSYFRGEPCLRELLANQLLEHAEPGASLSWKLTEDHVQFHARGELISRHPRNARGLWYAAELDDPSTHAAALTLVKQLGWPCITSALVLRDQTLSLHGEGRAELSSEQLRVHGALRIYLPRGAVFEEVVEPNEFRRALACRGGELGPWPPRHSKVRYELLEVAPSHANDASIVRAEIAVAEIPGLYYLGKFLTPRESEELVEHIDAAPWSGELKRRVQHYGWKYNYRARSISRDMRIGPLPAWAQKIASRLADAKLLPWVADQVIVNEYVEKQGISRHVDCEPCFEEDIAMVSLVEAWEMRFRLPRSKERIDRQLAVGSVAIMTGPARYDWTHEIPARKTEPGGRVRGRRISLTLRRVKLQ